MNEPAALDEIDLRDLLAVLFKWRWLIVGITLAAVTAAGIMSFFVLPPIYQSEMTLMIVRADTSRPQTAVQEDLETVVSPFSALPERTIDTYIAQLTSPELLAQVRDALRLDPAVYSVGGLAGLIHVSHVPNTNLIEVAVEHHDPILARQIADALAEQFLATLEEQNRTQLDRSVALLSTQLAETEQQLKAARARLDELLSRPRNAQVIAEDLNLQIQMLGEHRQQLAANAIAIQSTRAMLAELEAQRAATPATLERTETVRQPDGTDQLVTYQEPHPRYLELEAEIQSRRAELARLEGEQAALQERIANLGEQVAALQAELTKVQSEERAASAEVSTLERTQQLLREKMAETQILQSVNLAATSVLVVSPASTPSSPIRPRKGLNMAVAGLLGVTLSVLLAFVLNALDTTVKDPDEIEQLLGIPVVGHVPDFSRLKVS